MKIKNFCFYPSRNTRLPENPHPKRCPKHLHPQPSLAGRLTGGNYLWMPLEEESCIVFNITRGEADQMAQEFSQPYHYYVDIEAGEMADLPLSLPREAIADACGDACEAIQYRIEHSEKYRLNYERLLEQSLLPNMTGRLYWECRQLLYTGLSPIVKPENI